MILKVFIKSIIPTYSIYYQYLPTEATNDVRLEDFFLKKTHYETCLLIFHTWKI